MNQKQEKALLTPESSFSEEDFNTQSQGIPDLNGTMEEEIQQETPPPKKKSQRKRKNYMKLKTKLNSAERKLLLKTYEVQKLKQKITRIEARKERTSEAHPGKILQENKTTKKGGKKNTAWQQCQTKKTEICKCFFPSR